MREIDQKHWHRKVHYDLYSGFEFPHVNICVQLDITEFWTYRARLDSSPTVSLVYVITKSANRIPEFKQRIRGKQVVEHEVVHPLITVMGEDDLFGVISLTYDPSFENFVGKASKKMTKAKEAASMDEFPHDQDGDFPRDDLLSITILPWLEFTGFSITRKPSEDTIPLLAIGKVHQDGILWKLPFFVNIHHALADGIHVARIVKNIEDESRFLVDQFK
jgi:chloramphenicol O-acetyltransferase type A